MELSLRLAVDPVPASRPRFVRRGNFTGTYYAGRYKKFLQEDGLIALEAALRDPVYKDMSDPVESLPFVGPVMVFAAFHIPKPKTTKLEFPKGDIDNYTKGLLDILQPTVITNDNQVIEMQAIKQWANNQPHIKVVIQSL
mgnify:FL=1